MTDLREFLGSPQVRRWMHASKVKKLKNVSLPRMSVWNYGPCEHHETPDPTCKYRKCGGEPFSHQNVTAAYCYMARRSIVANSTGSGKTNSALMTLALAKDAGEEIRAVIVVPSSAVKQWTAETHRWAPGFKVENVLPKTPKRDRLLTYAKQWNCLIIGYHAFLRDHENIIKSGYKQVIFDDIDPALNHASKTWDALYQLTTNAEITIAMNATIASMHAEQIFAISSLVGAMEVWISPTNFVRDYVKKEKVTVVTRKGIRRKVFQTVGYKNLKDLRKKLKPMFIRFSYKDLEGALDVPSVLTKDVYLELNPEQKKRYEELQDGVRTIMGNDNMPKERKSVAALAAYTFASQIASGLFALKDADGEFEPDGEGASAKADWLLERLTNEWKGEKVIVYIKYRGSQSAVGRRLEEAGIGYSTISGAITDPEERQKEIDKFWDDPKTKVILISRSGERSLNLQNSRITVIFDQITNPGTALQVYGRSRRAGSKFDKVLIVNLLHEDTHEERIPLALASRNALQDFVYEESDKSEDDMVFEQLDPDTLLRLIAP